MTEKTFIKGELCNQRFCEAVVQYCDRTVNRCQECSRICRPEKTWSDCEKLCKAYKRLTTTASTTVTTTSPLQTSVRTIAYNNMFNIIPLLIIACVIMVILVLLIAVLLIFIPRIQRYNRNTKREIFRREGEQCTSIDKSCINEKYKSLNPVAKSFPNHYVSSKEMLQTGLKKSNCSRQTTVQVESVCTEKEFDLSNKEGPKYQNVSERMFQRPQTYDKVSPTQSMVDQIKSAIEFRQIPDHSLHNEPESLETSLKQIKYPIANDALNQQNIKDTEETPLISLHIEDEKHANDRVRKEDKIESQTKQYEKQQNVNKTNMDLPNFNCPERLYANTLDENKANTGKKKNKFIYEHLRKTPWVEGYFSEGHSIQVFVDLETTTEDWAIKQLCQETGQLPTKFHIKQSTELNY